MNTLGIVVVVLLLVGVFTLGWRWASRKWSLPCPSLLAWTLDNSLIDKSPMTLKTLDRIGFHPSQKVLEIEPGPGRLLIPAAKRVMPGGEVVGIDIQQKMIERLVKAGRPARTARRSFTFRQANVQCATMYFLERHEVRAKPRRGWSSLLIR